MLPEYLPGPEVSADLDECQPSIAPASLAQAAARHLSSAPKSWEKPLPGLMPPISLIALACSSRFPPERYGFLGAQGF